MDVLVIGPPPQGLGPGIAVRLQPDVSGRRRSGFLDDRHIVGARVWVSPEVVTHPSASAPVALAEIDRHREQKQKQEQEPQRTGLEKSLPDWVCADIGWDGVAADGWDGVAAGARDGVAAGRRDGVAAGR